MTEKIIHIHPTTPEPAIISQAADIFTSGGLVMIPTWCLYGMATHALEPAAIQRIFNIKQRPEENPILILVKGTKALEGLVKAIPLSAKILMERFWPGRITLVFPAHESLPTELTAGTGKIGIRIPEHPVAAALVKALPFPITGTSANISGQPGCSRIEDVPPDIIQKTDLVLDAGKLMGGPGSTVVDVTTDPIRILREGTVPAADIFAAINK